MGTYSSLDGIGKDSKPPYKYVPLNCTDIEVKSLHVFDEELHCSFGLASRSGWARVNDTGSPTLDSSGWWSGEALSSAEDLYLFGRGHDYKTALHDFTLVSGQVPMLPRYMLGVMWSQWYSFDIIGLHRAVDSFECHSLPLNVLILDMNFHHKPDGLATPLTTPSSRTPPMTLRASRSAAWLCPSTRTTGTALAQRSSCIPRWWKDWAATLP